MPPPRTGQLIAQFTPPSGQCWQATYSTPINNEPGQFKAKAD